MQNSIHTELNLYFTLNMFNGKIFYCFFFSGGTASAKLYRQVFASADIFCEEIKLYK